MKKVIGIIKGAVLAGVVVACVMVSAKDVKAVDPPTSGNCGTSGHESDVTWSYNDSTKTLTISGSGAMADYDGQHTVSPWYNLYRNDIEEVVFSNEITHIGNYAFDDCENLKSIAIPEGVITIGSYAFQTCKLATSITIPSSVTEINNHAFSGCFAIQSISIPSSVTTIGGYAFQACEPTEVIFSGDVSTDTINHVINLSSMYPTYLKSIVVPDNKIEDLRTAISGNVSLSDSQKETILSNLKSKTTYEAEKNAKPASNDSNKEQDEKETASEGTPTGPSKSVYEEKMDSLIKDINSLMSSATGTSTDKKSADGKKTLYLKDVTSLSLSAMKALKSNPNVNLDMTYTYKGIAFHVVIPAGTAVFDDSIPWYGPIWLFSHYGQGTLTNAGGKSANVCVVQSGDTLRKIAAKNGMTLDEIIRKNPQIKNIDKISIGDKINL